MENDKNLEKSIDIEFEKGEPKITLYDGRSVDLKGKNG